ncbi:MAG: hypothetical protein IT209_10490 [Armatimonadetes bacterium]|nr:hypothetical protein [Armatimonadota bacterium]
MASRVSEILTMLKSFKEARALLSAYELGLLSRLAMSAVSAAELSREKDLDERAVRALLDALVAMRIVRKRNGRYRLSSAGSQLMADRGETLDDASLAWRQWSEMNQVIQQGRTVVDSAQVVEEAERAKKRLQSGLADESWVQRLPIGNAKTILDVGGSAPAELIRLALAHPDVHCSALHLPGVVPEIERAVERAGMSERIAVIPGNYLFDQLPSGFDVVWISGVLPLHAEEPNRALLRNASEALNSGGRVLIRDLLLDEKQATEVDHTLFRLRTLASPNAVEAYTVQDVIRWLSDAGFIEATYQCSGDIATVSALAGG